jgi:hypothetical protein
VLGYQTFTQQLTEHAMRAFELMSLGQNVVLFGDGRKGAPDDAAQAAAQGERLQRSSLSPTALDRLASIEREMAGFSLSLEPLDDLPPPLVDFPASESASPPAESNSPLAESPVAQAAPTVEMPREDDEDQGAANASEAPAEAPVAAVGATPTAAKPKKTMKAVQLPVKELPDLEVLVCPRVDFSDWVLQTILAQGKRPNATSLIPIGTSSLSSSKSFLSNSVDDEIANELGLELGGGVEGYLGWFRRLVRCAASSNTSIKSRCLTILSSALVRLSHRLPRGSPLIHRFLSEVRAVARLGLEQVAVERFGTEKREGTRVIFSKFTCALFEWQATLRAVHMEHGKSGNEELRAPTLRIVDKMSTSVSLSWTSTRSGDAADVDSFSFVLEMGTVDPAFKKLSSGAKRAQQIANRLHRKAQRRAQGESDVGDTKVDTQLDGVHFQEVYRGPSLGWTSSAPVSATDTHFFRIKTVTEGKVSAWSSVTPLTPDRVIEHTSWDPTPAMLLQCDLRDDGRTAFLPNDPPYFPTLSGKTFWSSGVHTWRIKVLAIKGPVHFGVVMDEYDMTRPVGFDDKVLSY